MPISFNVKKQVAPTSITVLQRIKKSPVLKYVEGEGGRWLRDSRFEFASFHLGSYTDMTLILRLYVVYISPSTYFMASKISLLPFASFSSPNSTLHNNLRRRESNVK
jgi:hypothetical protein